MLGADSSKNRVMFFRRDLSDGPPAATEPLQTFPYLPTPGVVSRIVAGVFVLFPLFGHHVPPKAVELSHNNLTSYRHQVPVEFDSGGGDKDAGH